ncbi:MAG: thioredoxin family protein [Bacteroidia bacterium]
MDQHKTVLLVFKGSDWCAPCIKLDREVFTNEEFQAYATDHLVMLEADFPRKKANRLSDEQQAKNAALAEQYNQQGYFPMPSCSVSQARFLALLATKASPFQTILRQLKAFFNKN